MRDIRKKELEIQNILGNKVKIAEKAGASIKSQLWVADPWGGQAVVRRTVLSAKMSR